LNSPSKISSKQEENSTDKLSVRKNQEINNNLLESVEMQYNYTKDYTQMIIEETNKLVKTIERINNENSNLRRDKVG